MREPLETLLSYKNCNCSGGLLSSYLFGLFEKLDPQSPGSGIEPATVERIVKMH